MQIIMKSCRETHCHFCFSEAPADVVFCPLCTIPIYCSKRCLEQAVGQISGNQDSPEWNQAMDLANLSITSTSCKPSSSRHIAEHRHECGGVHWAAVLPSDVVLAGRIMSWYIEKRMLAGKGSAMFGPDLVSPLICLQEFPFSGAVDCCSTGNVTLRANQINLLLQDLVHHYDQGSQASKLESHIYAIVLFLCLQNYYRSSLSCTKDSLSQVHTAFIISDLMHMDLDIEYRLN